MSFSVIVAATTSGGIGLDGDLPWRNLLTLDLKNFKEITTGTKSLKCRNAVIMGRKTWQSLPEEKRPLPHRLNIIVSQAKQQQLHNQFKNSNDIEIVGSLSEALELVASAKYHDQIERSFVIGGVSLFNEALEHPALQSIYLTEVLTDFVCDRFIDPIPTDRFSPPIASNVHESPAGGYFYRFLVYERKNQHEEHQYLNLVKRIINHGNTKGDRTDTGIKSLFGAQMRFSLTDSFPLLTTKKVFWRGVVEELLWLIKGSTDSKLLAEKKVHIWDDNGSREFLDKLGFVDREVGDLGPGQHYMQNSYNFLS